MQRDVEKVLFTKEQIQERVAELAATLSEEYKDKNPVIVAILKGSVMLFADLVRNMSIPVQIDFISVASYGAGTESSGEVRLIKDFDASIQGRDVIVVEDVVDTGYTLAYLMRLLYSRNPDSVKVCALLDKKARRVADFEPDYVGFEIENEFVVGYGMDYKEKYRNLPYVAVLKKEIYSGDN